jgi:glycosyltransferase involved in cell wall biosynthesis
MTKFRVIHLISSLTRGGRERQLATIYKYADKEKEDIRIICFNRNENSYIEEYQMAGDVVFLESKSKIGRLIELRKIIKSEKFSIVWTWGSIEATLGILLSLSCKVNHINGSIRHGIVLKKFSHKWRMFMLHLSKNIVANSKSGLYANKLKRGFVFYNGLDKQFSYPSESVIEEIKDKFSGKEKKVILLSVANLVPYKDYPTVLNALCKLKEQGYLFHYLIIGEGSERKSIELLINKLGMHGEVKFLGRQTDVKNYLHAADIFIHSSQGEGCSNSILEAMAAGLPVIASDTGGTPEIVDAKVGRLFKYKDMDQLYLYIIELLESVELRKALGHESKERIKLNYSTERMMHDYYSILESVSHK